MGALEDKIQVTVLIQNCEITDSDLLFTSANPDEIIGAIRNLQGEGERLNIDDPRYQGDDDDEPELSPPAWKKSGGLH